MTRDPEHDSKGHRYDPKILEDLWDKETYRELVMGAAKYQALREPRFVMQGKVAEITARMAVETQRMTTETHRLATETRRLAKYTFVMAIATIVTVVLTFVTLFRR